MQLEAVGLISREKHPDSKANVLYQLTKKGIDFVSVLLEINRSQGNLLSR